MEFIRNGDTAELIFRQLRIDAVRLKAQLPESVTSVEAESETGMLRLVLGIPAAIDVRGFREDESFAVDIQTPRPAPKVAARPDGKPDPRRPRSPTRPPIPAPVPDASPEVAARPLVEGRPQPQVAVVPAAAPTPTTQVVAPLIRRVSVRRRRPNSRHPPSRPW